MEKLSIDEIIEHCKRKTEEYERLNGIKTLENADLSSNFIKDYWEHGQVLEYLQELKKYGELKKQGRLLELPYVPWSTVYWVNSWFFDGKIGLNHEWHITESEISKYIYDGDFWIKLKNGESILVSEFGKTLFATSEEAEAALQKLNGASS